MKPITERHIDKILDKYIPKNRQRLSVYKIYSKGIKRPLYNGKAQNTADRVAYHFFREVKEGSNKGRFGINGLQADCICIYPAHLNGYPKEYKDDKVIRDWKWLWLKKKELHLHPFDEILRNNEAWSIQKDKPIYNESRPTPNIAYNELFDAFKGEGGAYIKIEFKDGYIQRYELVRLYSFWGRVFRFMKKIFEG